MNTPDNKKSRVGRAERMSPNAPAKFEAESDRPPNAGDETAEPNPPGTFDPRSLVERLGIWRMDKGKADFLLTPSASGCRTVNKSDLKTICREHGVLTRESEPGGLSQFEQLYLYVIKERSLDAVIDKLAGWPKGVHLVNGRKVYVKRESPLIEPRAGEFPGISALMDGLFGIDAIRVHSWLKVAVEAFRERRHSRPGQVLMLIGPRAGGKSRFQHWIVTELLGGDSEDPSAFMIGETDFNQELFSVVHLEMHDPPLGEDPKSKKRFAARLKEFTVNDKRRLHPKGGTAFSLAPLWRVTMSLNDDDLSVLPFFAESLEDKLIALKCLNYNAPVGDGTTAEREAWEHKIKSEIAAYLYFLLYEFEIPPSLRCKRFGVLHYVHPDIRNALHEESPEARLTECFDLELWSGEDEPRQPWEGNPTDLAKRLQAEGSACMREARNLFKNASQLGKLLRRLTTSQPHRVQFVVRTSGKRLYRILPPSLAELDGKE